MITILIFPLALGQPAMFARSFTRKIDAQDYEDFWRRLGSCHIQRQTKYSSDVAESHSTA